MILNPSHEITLRGLPSDVLDAYVRYKKGSRAIVSWLVQFGPRPRKNIKTLPLNELASLAQSAMTCLKQIPEVIDFHFRETIAARKRLSQYFRRSVDLSDDDVDTENHEHFTASLTQIYSDLCQHCGSHDDDRWRDSRGSYSSRLAEPIKNHYSCLPVEECNETHENEIADNGCKQCQTEKIYSYPADQSELDIGGDEIGAAVETTATLERLHETIEAARSCWKEAGHGHAHFVSAAAVTNMAWSTIRDLEIALRKDNECLNIAVLHRRCCSFNGSTSSTLDGLPSKAHTLITSLEDSERVISHYVNCHQITIISNCPSCVQKPGDYVQKNSEVATSHRTSLDLALMDNMLHLLCDAQATSSIVQDLPVFADISCLLRHRNNVSTSFLCTIGLHLLTTTYKAYLSVLPIPSSVSTCRIAALKLSKQASSSLELLLHNKASFPCCCPETLARHLSTLKIDMDNYTKYRRWDLYFQSPWVAGNHIVDMLDTLSYYGMRLLHYRHYIGAVLHSYNILVQLADLKPIQLLEQLCEVFGEVLFPSGRPTTSFKNSWARYIGARLKFKKYNRKHTNEDDGWCMAVPAHTARGSAGLGIDDNNRKSKPEPKFDFARIDPMMNMKSLNWRVDTNMNPPRSRSSSILSSETATETPPILLNFAPPQSTASVSHPLTHHLDRLTRSITRPTSHLSTTRLNHLAIFHTATTLITRITTRIHGPVAPDSKGSGQGSSSSLCICFIQTLLTAADRIVNNRRFGGIDCWRKSEREVVNVVKGVLEAEFCGHGQDESGSKYEGSVRGMEAEEWLWKL